MQLLVDCLKTRSYLITLTNIEWYSLRFGPWGQKVKRWGEQRASQTTRKKDTTTTHKTKRGKEKRKGKRDREDRGKTSKTCNEINTQNETETDETIQTDTRERNNRDMTVPPPPNHHLTRHSLHSLHCTAHLLQTPYCGPYTVTQYSTVYSTVHCSDID